MKQRLPSLATPRDITALGVVRPGRCDECGARPREPDDRYCRACRQELAW